MLRRSTYALFASATISWGWNRSRAVICSRCRGKRRVDDSDASFPKCSSIDQPAIRSKCNIGVHARKGRTSTELESAENTNRGGHVIRHEDEGAPVPAAVRPRRVIRSARREQEENRSDRGRQNEQAYDFLVHGTSFG